MLGSWAALAILWVVFDMATWITVVFVAFTLPALWDVIADKQSWVEVHGGRLIWASPLGNNDVKDIDHVRINRRFDFGFRITVVHVGGATTRLPADLVPPVNTFEAALGKAGIAVQRHPFSII